MNVLLGIYGTKTFTELCKDNRNTTYPFFDLLDNWSGLDEIISIVESACHKCYNIYFSLDKVELPLNADKSITCGELQLILNTPRFLDKTIFLKDGHELSKEEFNNWINNN